MYGEIHYGSVIEVGHLKTSNGGQVVKEVSYTVMVDDKLSPNNVYQIYFAGTLVSCPVCDPPQIDEKGNIKPPTKGYPIISFNSLKWDAFYDDFVMVDGCRIECNCSQPHVIVAGVDAPDTWLYGPPIENGFAIMAIQMAEAEEEAKEQREQQARQKPSPPPLQQKIIPSGSKGKWAKPLNQKLEPNTCYQVDGDKVYETDHLGRVVKVEAMLSPSVKDRNTYQQRKAGKSGNPGDEGGHLIASIFNGPGEQINLLPMDGNLNKGEWKKMENKWAEALNAGSTVQVKIEPIYHGNNTRPDKFKVVYSMDHGKPIEKIFKNAPGGK